MEAMRLGVCSGPCPHRFCLAAEQTALPESARHWQATGPSKGGLIKLGREPRPQLRLHTYFLQREHLHLSSLPLLHMCTASASLACLPTASHRESRATGPHFLLSASTTGTRPKGQLSKAVPTLQWPHICRGTRPTTVF